MEKLNPKNKEIESESRREFLSFSFKSILALAASSRLGILAASEDLPYPEDERGFYWIWIWRRWLEGFRLPYLKKVLPQTIFLKRVWKILSPKSFQEAAFEIKRIYKKAGKKEPLIFVDQEWGWV